MRESGRPSGGRPLGGRPLTQRDRSPAAASAEGSTGQRDTAFVMAGHGRSYIVRLSDGNSRVAVTRARNTDCVVGDRVEVTVINAEQCVIEQVHPRRGLVQRSDAYRIKRIASNLDLAMVVISAAPAFDEALLLRVLASLQAAGVEARLVATKSDLPSHASIRPRLDMYRALGYVVHESAALPAAIPAAIPAALPSAVPAPLLPSQPAAPAVALRRNPGRDGGSGQTRADMEGGGEAAVGAGADSSRSARQLRKADHAELLEALAGRITLLLGQSGMGKSTLVNALIPAASQRTAAISEVLGAGRHTTTSSCAFDLDTTAPSGHAPAPAGLLIDSPGFQTYGIAHLSDWELVHAMPDLAPSIGKCRFNNCIHLDEPGCDVRRRVDSGEVDPLRYRLYCELMQERQR